MVARLRELSLLGVPLARIAERFNTTKNSVSGARFRNRISDKPEPAPKPEPKPIIWPSVHECRYILDHGPWRGRPPQWCMQRVRPGSVYCDYHHSRCYQR